MKKLLLAALLALPLAGCADTINPTPQQKAAALLDEEIQQVQNQISTFSGQLPSDRMRWSASSIKIQEDLYNRLDDLFRQRQILAKEQGAQGTFEARPASTTSTLIQQTSTPK